MYHFRLVFERIEGRRFRTLTRSQAVVNSVVRTRETGTSGSRRQVEGRGPRGVLTFQLPGR